MPRSDLPTLCPLKLSSTIARMISFENEIDELGRNGVIAPERAARLVAMERRELVSLHGELRFLTWIGVALTLAGLGTIVAKNLERIGPLSIVLALFAVAGAIDFWLVRRRSAHGDPGILDELLGTLSAGVLSTAVGYGEAQFNWFGDYGSLHLIFLAVAHAGLAYLLASPLVMSVALGTFAAWFGIDPRAGDWGADSTEEFALRAALASAAVMGWRWLHGRLRGDSRLVPPFDHVAANLAGVAAVSLALSDSGAQWAGAALGLVFAVFLWRLANARKSALFVVYAVVYGLIALLIPTMRAIEEPVLVTLGTFFVLLTAVVIIVVTILRWRER